MTRRHGTLALTASLAGALLLAACAGAGPTPTPVAMSVASAAPSAAPTAEGSAAPSVAASALPGGSAVPTPPDLGVSADRTLPPGMTFWPTSVIDATIALAAVDNELKKAAGDWTTGAQSQDMDLLLAAAQGMAYLADRSLPNAQRLADFPELATVGQDLVDVFTVISASGKKVADTASAGDTAGFESAIKDLSAGMAAYATARKPMIDAAELALVMRRGLLVK